MIRTRQPKVLLPNAIITADWHLREDTPICRIDDFWDQQWRKVDFINKLQVKYGCSVIHAGDLFNTWKPSPFLLSMTMKHLPDRFFTIYGNHDLPQHNFDLSYKTGIRVLEVAEKLTVLKGTHWEQEPNLSLVWPTMDATISMVVWHIMTWLGDKPWPGCTDPTAFEVLDKAKADIVITGHNHKTFTAKEGKRLLINPGSLTRQTVDQSSHSPCVFLWYAEANRAVPVFLPKEKGVVSADHLSRTKERDKRIDAFVSRISKDWDADVNIDKEQFARNLERFAHVNKVGTEVMDIIRRACDENAVGRT